MLMETNPNNLFAGGPAGEPNPARLTSGKITVLGLILTLLVFLTYLPVLQNEFIIYDDPDYVTANPQVQAGLTQAGAVWAWSSMVGGNWHPLTWYSHMLDCQLFGMNAWGHHLTNVLLHTANALLLFLVLERMTRAAGRSFFVAALFGVHATHVESVAWVAERKDVLSTFFAFLTLLAYSCYAQQRSNVERREPAVGVAIFALASRRRFLDYTLAGLFFVFGLMSKPMLVTIPLVMLLLDYWPLRRFPEPGSGTGFRYLILEKLPFFACSFAACVVALQGQTTVGGMRTMASFPLTARLENALVAYVRYLGKLFWPAKLPFFYPHPGHWPLAMVLAAAVLLAGISLGAWMTRRNHPYLLVGWCWYVVALLPVIGLVQVGFQSLANRYLYVPSIGIFLGVAWLAHAMTRRWRHQWFVLSASAAVVMLACIPITRLQIGYWKNSKLLFQYASVIIDNNWLAHARLGLVFSQEGRTDEAISEYHQALKLNPDDADTRYNLANALYRKGLLDEAISQYQESLKLNPNDASGHNNLGIVLFQKGRRPEAITQFQEALRLKPDWDEVRRNLAAAENAK